MPPAAKTIVLLFFFTAGGVKKNSLFTAGGYFFFYRRRRKNFWAFFFPRPLTPPRPQGRRGAPPPPGGLGRFLGLYRTLVLGGSSVHLSSTHHPNGARDLPTAFGTHRGNMFFRKIPFWGVIKTNRFWVSAVKKVKI